MRSSNRQAIAAWEGPPQGYSDAGQWEEIGNIPGARRACDGVGECEGDCDNACGFFRPAGQLWFRGDFLMWWTKSANLPPLVTSNPDDTAQDEAGRLITGTGLEVLFGGGGVDPGTRPGARFTLGYSLPQCQDSGIEVTYLFLSNKSADFSRASAAGSPILARPFFNVETFEQDAVLIAYPGLAETSLITVGLSNELQSLDLISRQAIFQQPGQRVDFLCGYKYSRFAERLAIGQSFTAGPDQEHLVEGTTVVGSDVFAAGNEFHGFEVGLATQTQYYRWSFEGLAKIALGGTRSRVTVNGTTTITTPAPDATTDTTQGDLLAMPTNIGRYSQSEFSAIPEVGFNVGFDVTRRMRATFGYSLLYWSQVARPGDQIDAGNVAGASFPNLNANKSQLGRGVLTGVPAPQFKFATTDFWAQGLNFGIDWRY